MEITQGISLCSYLYLKLAKIPCFSNYILCFFLLQNWRTGGQNRFCQGRMRGGVWYRWEEGGSRERGRRVNMIQIMYTHVCKCKNDKNDTC
jgi:hypothetical protein